MKREDVRKVLGEDATDEQVQAMMDLYQADINPLKEELKEAKSKATDLEGSNADLAAQLQAKADEAAQAAMTAEEQLAAAQAKAEQMQRDLAIKTNTLDAKAKFVDAGFSEEDYSEVLSKIVSDDAKATSALADSVIALVNARSESAVSAAKTELLGNTPEPQGASATSGAMTQEQFDNLSYSERVAMFESAPETYEKFTTQND